jgi:acyl-CoA thioester hydrolase
MSFRFFYDHPLRWGDIDSCGVLNNAVYLSLLEQARYEYCRQLGLLDGVSFPFLLGETTIRFLKPGRAGMTVTIAARTRRLGNKSLEQEYEVRHGAEVLATARATLIYADRSLQSREIPDEARQTISAFEGIPLRGE